MWKNSGENCESIAFFDLDLETKKFVERSNLYSTLSDEEYDILVKRYNAGDKTAKEKIFNHSLEIIINNLNRYVCQLDDITLLDNFEYGDLLNEAIYIFLGAFDKFDINRGHFSNFIGFAISRRFDAIIYSKRGLLNPSLGYYEKKKKYDSIIDVRKRNAWRIPSDDFLSRKLHTDKHNLSIIKANEFYKIVGLSDAVDEDYSLFFEDIVASNDQKDNDNSKELFLMLRSILSPLEYYIIYNHYLIENKKTLEKIGLEFNTIRQYMAEINNKALNKINKYASIRGIRIPKKYSNESKLSKVRIEPIQKRDVIKYMYIKDCLSDLENQLYYLLYFADFVYDDIELAHNLRIPVEDLMITKESLRQKVANKMADGEDFKIYYEYTNRNTKTTIYDVVEEAKENCPNYDQITNDFLGYNYSTIQSILGDCFHILSIDELSIFSDFYNKYTDELFSITAINELLNYFLGRTDINILEMDKDIIKILLKENNDILPRYLKFNVCKYLGFKYRELMNEDEINSAYHILYKLIKEKKNSSDSFKYSYK